MDEDEKEQMFLSMRNRIDTTKRVFRDELSQRLYAHGYLFALWDNGLISLDELRSYGAEYGLEI